MEKRKIGEGVSDHTDERGPVSPLNSVLLCCQETTNEQQCLCAASSNRKPSDLLFCLPMGALTHPSHLRMKVFLAKLPTSEGTGQRKQIGRKKSNGEASCSHRLPPLLFSFPSPACGPREGSAHIRLEPAMPCQIFQCSKWVKTQGERLTIEEDLTAFHLKLELKTERILIKLFPAVAIGTHYLGLQPHLHTGEQQVRPPSAQMEN